MQISVRLDEATAKALQSLADDTKRTKSFYVKEAINRLLDDMNDYQAAVSELKRIQKEPKFYSLDEVAKECGVKL